MFFEILFFIFLGFIIGAITGLIPGLHPNTIYMFLLSLIPLMSNLDPYNIFAFAVSLAVTNTFIDFIPSLIFGAPEEGSELSVLPGHKMVLKGRGHHALYMTVLGGFFSSVIILLFVPAMIIVIPALIEILRSYIHILLIIVLLWMVISDRGFNRFWGLFVFFSSGVFGIILLNSVYSDISIFPALSGMFGISALITSSFSKGDIPKQKKCMGIKVSRKGVITGLVSGFLVGLLPGIGSSQAGVISAQTLKSGMKDFITAVGGINTANIIFTLIVLYSAEKTRSGLVVFVSQILDVNVNMLMIMVPVVLITSSLCLFIAPRLGWLFLSRISSVNYGLVVKIVMCAIISMVYILSGPIGLIICIVGTFIGIFCITMNIRRSYMMGFFMLTTILYFAGVSVPFL